MELQGPEDSGTTEKEVTEQCRELCTRFPVTVLRAAALLVQRRQFSAEMISATIRGAAGPTIAERRGCYAALEQTFRDLRNADATMSAFQIIEPTGQPVDRHDRARE